MSEISFPFLRARQYTFAQLRAFEAELLKKRQQDPAFSGLVRSNKIAWAKTRNEELLPIVLLANHQRIADSDSFELMPEGHSTDVQVHTGAQTIAYQITVADPYWGGSGRGQTGGYLHHLRMELVGLGQPAFGGANTKKENRTIISQPHARDVRDDIDACQQGLISAVNRKQVHDGSCCTLLIYARGYRFLLIDLNIGELVGSVIRQSGALSFERVSVVDEGLFWEAGNELE